MRAAHRRHDGVQAVYVVLHRKGRSRGETSPGRAARRHTSRPDSHRHRIHHLSQPLRKPSGKLGRWQFSQRVFVLPSVRNMKRHKLASLLPTWRRGLDRLYSKSLSTGALQDLQRPHLHGVPHGTPRAGRPCWRGLYGLFSAKASR
jgi:hypothetical protein